MRDAIALTQEGLGCIEVWVCQYWLEKETVMSEDGKTNLWGFGGAQRAAGVEDAGLDVDAAKGELAFNEKKPSSEYDIIQIAPVERFNVQFKSGSKQRLACWVMLRHKQTQEIVLTGAISPPNGGNGRLMLAIDLKDVDKFTAM
jgi:hypothetical protein